MSHTSVMKIQESNSEICKGFPPTFKIILYTVYL